MKFPMSWVVHRIQMGAGPGFVVIMFALGLTLFGCSATSDSPEPAESPPAPAAPPAPPPPPPPPVVPGPPTRPFFMGFTLWPADLSDDGLRTAQDFAYAHGDIVSVALIGGLPWSVAVDVKPFFKILHEAVTY